MAETALHKPRIGDDANDGAEQGGDQDVARGFMGLLHGATMRGVQPAIKSQLIQNGPISASAGRMSAAKSGIA